MLIRIVYFIIFILLCIVGYQILTYKEALTSYKPPKPPVPPPPPTATAEPTPTTQPPQPPIVDQPQPLPSQPATPPPPTSDPNPLVNETSLSNSSELALLTQNSNDIININTELSTMKDRLNTIQQHQTDIMDQSKYLASTQQQPANIKPLFDGPMTDYPDYTYQKCWSYGNIDNGLNYPVVNGGIFPAVSMNQCVQLASTNNFDTAAYNGDNLCLAGGSEYKKYTQQECSSDIYGKKAWQVYSKV